MRSFERTSVAVFCLLGVPFGVVACRGESGVSAACTSCAQRECPGEAAACSSTAGCQGLLSCALSCQSGDSSCQNGCVSGAANNSAAIVASANYVACADARCTDACHPSSGGGTGSSGGGSGGNTGSGGDSPPFGSGGAPPNGSPGYCIDQLRWAVGCAVETQSPFRSCTASALDQCRAQCYAHSDCEHYFALMRGESNPLSTCVLGCEISYGGGTPAPTCVNAAAKWAICGLSKPPSGCDDSNSLHQCHNQCLLRYDCQLVFPEPLEPDLNAYTSCVDTCSIDYGGPNTRPVDGLNVAAGGYVTTSPQRNGGWNGFAWTGTDGVSATTISPADFSAVPVGGSLCVHGTVAGTSDYSAVAMLGINLNQAVDAAPGAELTWVPYPEGMRYAILNASVTTLRIQIQTNATATTAAMRWCIDIGSRDASGSLVWTNFNTKCWAPATGTYFDGRTPLSSIQVLVPGGTSAIPFNFCLRTLCPN